MNRPDFVKGIAAALAARFGGFFKSDAYEEMARIALDVLGIITDEERAQSGEYWQELRARKSGA